MKITRGQLRAAVDRTQGYVDELECELDPIPGMKAIVLRVHHLRMEIQPSGRYVVRDDEGEIVSRGVVEPITNEGWFKSALDG